MRWTCVVRSGRIREMAPRTKVRNRHSARAVVRRGWKTQEPLDDRTPAEKPHLLANAIRVIHADDPGHMDDACARTALSIADISRYCAIPDQSDTIRSQDQIRPRVKYKGGLEPRTPYMQSKRRSKPRVRTKRKK
jgi:hypothetical protein